jgi:S1-C subfamily serine protease
MSEPTTSSLKLWQKRWQHFRPYLQNTALFIAGVLAVLTALLFYNYLTPDPPQLTTHDVDDSIAEALASVTPAPALSARVYHAIQPSLIFIQIKRPDEDEDGEVEHGVGSGVVINGNGDILTSLHVVDKATDIQLIFADGSQSSAQVIVAQPENDIAVLHPSEPPGLIVPAILGNPNAMRIGDEAFVVGNPLGLYGSMSAGVISGFNRSFQPQNSDQKLEGLIQIDAAVNPGNSGGPLLNRGGQVIGIVTGLVNPTEQEVFIGIGFAVPINVAAAAAGVAPY